MSRARSRWPLVVIGLSAGTAVWSGWVGLGGLVGFGVVHPLPGIADGLRLNTAITLPIGVEAYSVYALGVATSSATLTATARRFAWASAFGALLLGMLGQVGFHLMAARGVTHAPWPVVALVSCLPVGVLGVASLLWHLAAPTEVPEAAPTAPVEVPTGAASGADTAAGMAETLAPPTGRTTRRTTSGQKPATPQVKRRVDPDTIRAMARQEPSLSRAELARTLGVGTRTITRHLNGHDVAPTAPSVTE